MKGLLLSTLLLLFAARLTADGVSPVSKGRRLAQKRIAPGLSWSRWKLSKSIRDHSGLANILRSYATDAIELQVLVVDPKFWRISVVDASTLKRKRAPIQDFVERLSACAAVNAGFYDEKDHPVGLHISRGKVLSPWGMRHKRSAGIFYLRDDRWNIIANGTYRAYWHLGTPPSPMTEAVQCYPLLVARSRVLRKWKAGSKIAARTAVGIDGKGRICFAVSENDILSGLSLAEMARFMRGPLQCRLALNLDGGPSTQMYLKHGTILRHVKGREDIRNALAIFPRKAGQ